MDMTHCPPLPPSRICSRPLCFSGLCSNLNCAGLVGMLVGISLSILSSHIRLDGIGAAVVWTTTQTASVDAATVFQTITASADTVYAVLWFTNLSLSYTVLLSPLLFKLLLHSDLDYSPLISALEILEKLARMLIVYHLPPTKQPTRPPSNQVAYCGCDSCNQQVWGSIATGSSGS